MWWIVIVIIVVVVFLIAFIVVFVLLAIYGLDNHSDSSGIHIGGKEHPSHFVPANELAGILGEKTANYLLKPLLREDEYLLANVLLPLRNGYKTEIDCILISRKGIFCIETKKWVGHISGNDESDYWYQEYDDPDMSDKRHKNPVKQNEGHCAILERKLNNRFFVNNIVIFVDLEDGWGINSRHAFTIRQFKNYYNELDDNEISSAEIKPIYQQLVKYAATLEELDKHKKETKRRFD